MYSGHDEYAVWFLRNLPATSQRSMDIDDIILLAVPYSVKEISAFLGQLRCQP